MSLMIEIQQLIEIYIPWSNYHNNLRFYPTKSTFHIFCIMYKSNIQNATEIALRFDASFHDESFPLRQRV